ncbi:DUF2948 family protein [Neomegalonema sp.]|uniref:DUF2948 family protein n=1 Tax=Neomegalonema sp. TaxID=2039713 RepID=UPI00261F4503|nr:DUF2948 family protein [Neomegalonema sp.]MDD2869497.1 DUF2948 family protein [Neomegalonema sp.]
MTEADRRPQAVAPRGLRLRAQDPEDLEILSALLQDAVGRVGDVRWNAAERRFLLPLQRFRWEEDGRDERVRTALAFEHVRGAQARGLRPGAAPETALNLLSVEFRRAPPSGAEPADEETGAPSPDPGGEILLTCSGGAAFRLRVESLEVSLTDLAPPRAAAHRPRHARSRTLAREGALRRLFKGKGS